MTSQNSNLLLLGEYLENSDLMDDRPEDTEEYTGEDLQMQEDYLLALRLQQEEEEAMAESRRRSGSQDTTEQTWARGATCDASDVLFCNACVQPIDRFTLCGHGHLICKACLKIAIVEAITSDEMFLKCPAAQCTGEISMDDLTPLEPNLMIELFKEHVQKKQNFASENLIQKMGDILVCPKCQNPAVLEGENTFYQCVNKDCHVIFCRFCKSSQAVARKARLTSFSHAHESCRILQYGGQSSPSDLSAPPAHWEFFTDEDYKAARRQDHKNGTFNNQGILQKFYTTIIPRFLSTDIPYDQAGGYTTVRLAPESLESDDIKAHFERSSSRQILEIYRVQNMTCWEKYVLKRKHMIKELGEDGIRETFLYHGTSKETIDFICREGFDFRKPSVTDAWYGKGNYFTDKASYAEKYAKSNFLLMVCVLLGRMTQGMPEYTHPPYDPTTGQMFNCCVDYLFSPLEFVIFCNDQCYPAYVIEFRK